MDERTMREEFEAFQQWWTRPHPTTGTSMQQIHGNPSSVAILAYSAGQRAEREACIQAVETELLTEPDAWADDDHAYNRAIGDAATAIRTRAAAAMDTQTEGERT